MEILFIYLFYAEKFDHRNDNFKKIIHREFLAWLHVRRNQLLNILTGEC